MIATIYSTAQSLWSQVIMNVVLIVLCVNGARVTISGDGGDPVYIMVHTSVNIAMTTIKGHDFCVCAFWYLSIVNHVMYPHNYSTNSKINEEFLFLQVIDGKRANSHNLHLLVNPQAVKKCTW